MLFERQKAALCLVVELGGSVTATDFQKLAFLWSKSGPAPGPGFDFIPYRFGAFSLTSYADRRKLVQKGLLEEAEDAWTVTAQGRSAASRYPGIKKRCAAFLSGAPDARGEELVAMTYVQYPFYATQSEIAERVLRDNPKALKAIAAKRVPPAAAGLVTIGYEGRSLEGYLLALLRDGVTLLCDVRRNAISRRYGFAKSTLSNGCAAIGIRYEHLRDLGIDSASRRGLSTKEDFDALFARYSRDDLPHCTESLSQIATWVANGERVALTCFERSHRACHRHCIAETLEEIEGEGFRAKHL